jgi:hypothetical protein
VTDIGTAGEQLDIEWREYPDTPACGRRSSDGMRCTRIRDHAILGLGQPIPRHRHAAEADGEVVETWGRP